MQRTVQASGTSSTLEESVKALSNLSQFQMLLGLAKKMDDKKNAIPTGGHGLVSKETGDPLPLLDKSPQTLL